MKKLLIVFASLLVLAGTAHAEPTDVVNVPTADVIGRSALRLQLGQELYRDQDNDDDDKRTNLQTTFGLLDRVEIGLDVNDVTNESVFEGDVKFQLADPDRARIGLAVGAYNIGGGGDLFDDDFVAYGVATGRTGAAALTIGVGGSDENVGALFAGTFDVSPRVQVFADYDDAQDLGRASLGALYRFNNGVLARAYYTDGDDDLQVVRLEVALTARLVGDRT